LRFFVPGTPLQMVTQTDCLPIRAISTATNRCSPWFSTMGIANGRVTHCAATVVVIPETRR